MNQYIIILLIIFILLVLYFLFKKNKNVIRTRSEFDNKEYLVQNVPDRKRAAYILGVINHRIDLFTKYLEENMDNYPEYKKYIKDFCTKIPNRILMENFPGGNRTSYTVNRGQQIVLCLRSSKTNKFHDINLIMYVTIHELAHVACPEEGHTELFKKIFIFFLRIAISIGIYRKQDYSTRPRFYCGMVISDNLLD
jgi:predicted metal-dependent hydrolase